MHKVQGVSHKDDFLKVTSGFKMKMYNGLNLIKMQSTSC